LDYDLFFVSIIVYNSLLLWINHRDFICNREAEALKIKINLQKDVMNKTTHLNDHTTAAALAAYFAISTAALAPAVLDIFTYNN
jgi:hypothetical protein